MRLRIAIACVFVLGSLFGALRPVMNEIRNMRSDIRVVYQMIVSVQDQIESLSIDFDGRKHVDFDAKINYEIGIIQQQMMLLGLSRKSEIPFEEELK